MMYKYHLKTYIAKLPKSVKVKDICEAIAITEPTFYKYCRIELGSKERIPSDELDKFAEFFNLYLTEKITMKTLLNFPTQLNGHIKL